MAIRIPVQLLLFELSPNDNEQPIHTRASISKLLFQFIRTFIQGVEYTILRTLSETELYSVSSNTWNMYSNFNTHLLAKKFSLFGYMIRMVCG